MAKTEHTSIRRVQSGKIDSLDDMLVVEQDVAISVGGELLIRTTCSPGQLRQWVIGYLFSEGLIACPDDIAEVREATAVFSVDVAPSAPFKPGPLASLDSNLTVDLGRVLALAAEVAARAEVFHRTGGTHAMAIATGDGLISLAEDISRTCALEKALGLALLDDAGFAQSIAILSSRIPSRMIAKLARCGVPIVAAVSAPTIDAVRLAEELNICLCGFVRGERANVYAHGWRVGV